MWSFTELMNGSVLAAIKTRLASSSNNGNMHEVVSDLVGRYATEAVITKADEEICEFKEGSLTPWDFSQQLCDPTLRFSVVYN